jgi:hypothetical protein
MSSNHPIRQLNRQAIIGSAIIGGVEAWQVWKATNNRNATTQAFFNGTYYTYVLCLVCVPSIILLLLTPFILVGGTPPVGLVTLILGVLGVWWSIHIQREHLRRFRLLRQGILLRGPRQSRQPQIALPVQNSLLFHEGRWYVYDVPSGLWYETGQK